MKPEHRSRTLLGVTRSKAKMFEYDVPAEHHINILQDPAKLFPLSIGMLGDIAARSSTSFAGTSHQPAYDGDLQFSARFFDAYVQGKFEQELDPYMVLLGAASYYLCDLPGSAGVLARLIGEHAQDLGAGGLEDLLRWILQGVNSPPVEVSDGPFATVITRTSTELEHFLRNGTGLDNLFTQCVELRRIAYGSGTPRQLLLADVASALIRKKCSSSSWRALPLYTDLPMNQWLDTLKKPGFISELWPAQHLLGQAGVLRGESAVVQMPTSAGKTRATELIIRSAFLAERTSLAVIVAPFRALCHEMTNTFTAAFRNEPVNVDEMSDVMQDDFDIADLLKAKQVLVVTPEKFVYVLRHNPELAAEIGVLILDEGHQFDTGTRGITYELLVTSLKSLLPPTVQTVLISAVMSNASALAEWLNGAGSAVVSGTKLLPTFRTVGFVSWTTTLGRIDFVADSDPETSEFYVPRVIEQLPLAKRGRERKSRVFPDRSDGQSVALLLGLKLVKNGAVAVFCGRKTTAASVSTMAVDIFDRNVPLTPPAAYSDPGEVKKLTFLYEQNLGAEAPATRSAELGMFAHHGNTPQGIRLAVEHAIRSDLARFVICTSTLAQGVNLPIRYLLVTSLYQGSERIKVRDFHNLIGRAGRAGMHTEGSILFADADIYDKKKSHADKWRWIQVKELLEPANAEPCISSLLSFFEPLRSEDRRYSLKLDAFEFLNRYIGSPHDLAELAETVAKDHGDKGFTRQGLDTQIAFKSNLIAAVESFLMAHWDAGERPMKVDDAVALAPRTLAYFLADSETKERLVSLFRIIAENISARVTEPDRRKLYGRTLYGVSVSQAIEAWVRTHLSELLSAEDPIALLAIVWPLLLRHNQNTVFRKCSKPEALQVLAVEWISGKPFNAILENVTNQGARLVWGQTFRELTIDHAVDMCESGLGFDSSLLLSAITETVGYLAPPGVEDLTGRLQSLQKMMKYGLATSGSIILYELGFADRTLAMQLSRALNVEFDEKRRDVIKQLKENSAEVNGILSQYPAYFSYVATRLG